MRIVEKNFESFTRPQQIKHLEVEGYLVIPKVLNQRQINDIKIGMSDAEMLHTDYSTKQTRSVLLTRIIGTDCDKSIKATILGLKETV